MKNLLLTAVLFLPLITFAGGSKHVTHTPPTAPNIPPVNVPVPVPAAVIPQTSTPTPTASNGGGWSGGCSTYAQGTLPPWGVVPCVPTSPTQPPAVTPQSLTKYPEFIPMSALPYTGYNPSLPQYLWDLFVGFLGF